MQQMQEPEGRGYSEGYQIEPEYSMYDGKQQGEEYAEQPRPQYENDESSQQKIRPSSKASLTLAILSIVASAIIMGCAIALVALSAVTFAHSVELDQVFGPMIASLVLSIILLAFSVAAFVFSIVQ